MSGILRGPIRGTQGLLAAIRRGTLREAGHRDIGPISLPSAVLAFDPAPWVEQAGWTPNGDGTATWTGEGTSGNLQAYNVLEADATYDVSFTVTGLTGGTISFRFGDLADPDIAANADGTYTGTVVATGGQGISFRAVAATGTVVVSDFEAVKTS